MGPLRNPRHEKFAQLVWLADAIGAVLPTKLPDIGRDWTTKPNHALPTLAPAACSKMLKSKRV
jgi:hypothetical protein